jgi:DNA-binding HxlR family transcriptional regulator
MSDREEDPYSRIFSILKHPTRRLILRSLAQASKKRFSQLQSELNVDSPTLSYHLEALKELVEKKNEFYSATDLGKAALNMMQRVEEPPMTTSHVPQDPVRTGLVWVMVLLLIGAGLFVLLQPSSTDPSHTTYSRTVPFDLPSGGWTSFSLQIWFNPIRATWYRNGVIAYLPTAQGWAPFGTTVVDLPDQPGWTPWATTVIYSYFTSDLVNGSAVYWLSWPNGSSVTQPRGYSAEETSLPGSYSFYAPVVNPGNYTFHIMNDGFTRAVGSVTYGPSTVVYSRLNYFGSLLLLAPAIGYIANSAYQARKHSSKPLSGTYASDNTPKSFLKQCPSCGHEIPIAALSCYHCGTVQKN